MATKHSICPRALEMLSPGPVQMVSNLPYNIATPLIAECMFESWRACVDCARESLRFESLTFTVQKEVADRLVAQQGKNYGPISVIIALLGRISPGPVVPSGAFWPRPAVSSRIVRIDTDQDACARLKSAETLQKMLAQVFNQRRKKIGAAGRPRNAPFDRRELCDALGAAQVDSDSRPDNIEPETYLAVANTLSE